LAFFPEIGDAARCAQACNAAGVNLGRCEMMDDSMMKIINVANGASFPEKTCLMFDIHGGNLEEIQSQLTTVKEMVGQFNGSDMRYETSPDKMKELWSIRKEALWSCSSARPEGSAMITDVCVPQSQLAEVVSATKVELKDRLESRGIPAPIVAHTLDGNFHAFIIIDTDSSEEMDLAHDVAHNMVHRAIDAGGSCTGEHGIGTGKIEYLEHELGLPAVQMMMSIKNALDPNNIMNPSKVLPDSCKLELASVEKALDGTKPRHYVLRKKGGEKYSGAGDGSWS
jgi:D-lactate dehydrogenase (cytochrome)